MSFEVIIPFLRPIAHLIQDPDVTEIMVNGGRRVFIERHGLLQEVEGVRVDVLPALVPIRWEHGIELTVAGRTRIRVVDLEGLLRLKLRAARLSGHHAEALTVVRCAAGRPVSMLTRASCPASVIE